MSATANVVALVQKAGRAARSSTSLAQPTQAVASNKIREVFIGYLVRGLGDKMLWAEAEDSLRPSSLAGRSNQNHSRAQRGGIT
jgi:hypothetical protein